MTKSLSRDQLLAISPQAEVGKIKQSDPSLSLADSPNLSPASSPFTDTISKYKDMQSPSTNSKSYNSSKSLEKITTNPVAMGETHHNSVEQRLGLGSVNGLPKDSNESTYSSSLTSVPGLKKSKASIVLSHEVLNKDISASGDVTSVSDKIADNTLDSTSFDSQSVEQSVEHTADTSFGLNDSVNSLAIDMSKASTEEPEKAQMEPSDKFIYQSSSSSSDVRKKEPFYEKLRRAAAFRAETKVSSSSKNEIMDFDNVETDVREEERLSKFVRSPSQRLASRDTMNIFTPPLSPSRSKVKNYLRISL